MIKSSLSVHSRKTLLWLTYIILVSIALYPAYLLEVRVITTTIDVPYLDDWLFVPVLQKAYAGTLTLTDLSAPQASHRLLIPRIILVLLAKSTNWNMLYPVCLNLVLGVLIFLCYLALFHRRLGQFSILRVLIIAPIISLFAFSFVQWNNWRWGWQIAIFINILATVAGIYFLTGSGHWKNVGLGIVCTTIAVWSFATGFVLIVVGTVLLTARRFRWCQRGAWYVAIALLAASYVHHLPLSSPQPEHKETLEQQVSGRARFILEYLGSPMTKRSKDLSADLRQARLWGIILIISWLATSAFLMIPNRKDRTKPIPCLALAVFALGCAILTSIGRYQLSHNHSLLSRYTSFSLAGWIALVLLIYLSIIRLLSSRRKKVCSHLILSGGLVIILCALSIRHYQISRQGADALTKMNGDLRRDRNALLMHDKIYYDLRTLQTGYVTDERVDFLRQNRLSLYRER